VASTRPRTEDQTPNTGTGVGLGAASPKRKPGVTGIDRLRGHGSPFLEASIQPIISAGPIVSVCDRVDSRTEPTRATSSIFRRRASSGASGNGLSHNSSRAGSIHCSIAYFRPRMSRWRGVGGFRQRMAISRMLVKPHRVDKSKIDDSSSNERSSVELKSLAKKEKFEDQQFG